MRIPESDPVFKGGNRDLPIPVNGIFDMAEIKSSMVLSQFYLIIE
jgi:hypothetical protein